jgi:hypothetical protein
MSEIVGRTRGRTRARGRASSVCRLTKAVKFVAGPSIAALVVGVAGGTVVRFESATELASSSPFEVVVVNSAAPDGAATTRSLQAGWTYVLEASGTFQHGQGQADAECATVPGDQRWLRSPYPAYGADFVDLLVDGTGVEWQPTNADVNNCNSADHGYVYTVTPASTGTLNLRVNDVVFTDNVGVLTVSITEQAPGDPVGDAQDDIQDAEAEAQRVFDDATETVEGTRGQVEEAAAGARDDAEGEAEELATTAEEEAADAQDQAEAEAEERSAKAEEEAAAARDDAEGKAEDLATTAGDTASDAQDEAESIVGPNPDPGADPGPVAEAVLAAIGSLEEDAGEVLGAVQETEAPALDPGPDPDPDPEPDPEPDPDPDPDPEPEPDPDPDPDPKADADVDPDPDPKADQPARASGNDERSTPGTAPSSGAVGTAPSSGAVGTAPSSGAVGTAPSSGAVGTGLSPADGPPPGSTPEARTEVADHAGASASVGALPDDLFAFERFEAPDEQAAGRQTRDGIDIPTPSESKAPVVFALLAVLGFTLTMALRVLRNARSTAIQRMQRYR